MKLQQLRYAVEVFRRNLNVSDAADALFTSQPGVSKQIRLLEEELGVQIFIRNGKRIVSVTPAGTAVLETAERILRDVQSIRHIGNEFSQLNKGVFIIAATHALLRFGLPAVIERFKTVFTEVQVMLKQGTPAQIVSWVNEGEVDLALVNDVVEDLANIKKLPCGAWHYVVVMSPSHPLAQASLSLSDIANYPLLTYDSTFATGSLASRAFLRTDIPHCQVAFESNDAQVLLQYARLGLGIALLDNTAVQSLSTDGLVVRHVGHLFAPAQYYVLLRDDALVRSYVYDFMAMVDDKLTRETVDKWLYAPAVVDFSI